jgi:hypothetical protein
MSVDFPAPDGPSNTRVAPSGYVLHQFLEAVALLRGGGDNVHPGGLQDDLPHNIVRQMGEVGFGDDYKWRGTGIPCSHQRPFEPVVG